MAGTGRIYPSPWPSQQLKSKKQFSSQSPQRYRKMADETPSAKVLHLKLVIGTLPEYTKSKDKYSKKYSFERGKF